MLDEYMVVPSSAGSLLSGEIRNHTDPPRTRMEIRNTRFTEEAGHIKAHSV